MKSHFPLWALVLFGLSIFLFNLLATYWHLFFLIWWLDIPVHILSGAWVALVMLVLYYHADNVGRKDHTTLFVVLFALSSSLIIGLMWEVYEFVVDRAMAGSNLQLGDTLKDLCDDLVGGAAAAWIFIQNGYNKHI